MSLAVVGIGAGLGLFAETAGYAVRKNVPDGTQSTKIKPEEWGERLTLSGKMLQLFPAVLFLSQKSFGFLRQHDWIMTGATSLGAAGLTALGLGHPACSAWASRGNKNANTVSEKLEATKLPVDLITKGVNLLVVLSYAHDLNALGTRASKAFGLGLGLGGLGMTLAPLQLGHTKTVKVEDLN